MKRRGLSLRIERLRTLGSVELSLARGRGVLEETIVDLTRIDETSDDPTRDCPVETTVGNQISEHRWE